MKLIERWNFGICDGTKYDLPGDGKPKKDKINLSKGYDKEIGKKGSVRINLEHSKDLVPRAAA